MDLKLDEVEALLCSTKPEAGWVGGVAGRKYENFLKELRVLCKSRNTNFETWMEMLFLKNSRMNNAENLWNISESLYWTGIEAKDIKELYYNIILSSLSNSIMHANDQDYQYKILSRPEAKEFIHKFLAKLPIALIPSLINKLHQNDVSKDFALYLAVFDEKEFITIHKFSSLFNDCSFKLKQDIIFGGFCTNNYSFISRLNSYFEEHPFTFNAISSNFNDDDNFIIKAIVSCISISSLNISLTVFKDYIIANPNKFPKTMEALIIKAIKEYSPQFIIDAGKLFSKKKILSLLIEYKDGNGADLPYVVAQGTNSIINKFIEKFGDDPEIEQFVAFA